MALYGRIYFQPATAAAYHPCLNESALHFAHLIRRWGIPRVPLEEGHVIYVIFVFNPRMSGMGAFYVGKTTSGVKTRFS